MQYYVRILRKSGFLSNRIRNALQYRARPYIKLIKIKLLTAWRKVLVPNRSGINLIGYFSYTFGVAEVGRFFAQHVKKAAVPLQIYDVESSAHKKLDALSLKAYESHFTNTPSYHKNVFFINADQIAYIKEELPALFIGRYNAAVFFWEFNDYFDFPNAFEVIDEVFAFTEFIATAVRKVAPPSVKVTKLPFPFMKNWEINKPVEVVRKQYNVPGDTFIFIFNFDFFSVYTRKNPEAILKAFEMAFNATDNVCLILKTIHAEADSNHNLSFQAVLNEMKLKEKIICVNDNLDRNDFMSLLNASDCYISLHRSEGLGLGMLEAMSMGKPVIATNYGGNTDFMREGNSLPVNYTLVPVTEDAAPYKPGWLWADADIEAAGGYMRKLYNDPAFTSDLGRRAQESVDRQYSNDIFEKRLVSWMRS